MVPESDRLHVLYAEHAHELQCFARRRIGAEDAADVVHDTYLRVLQYAEQDELENPRAYLYRVAANVSLDRGIAYQKANERIDAETEPDMLQSTAPDLGTQLDVHRRLQRCVTALEDLPLIYRHVFLLHRIDGMTQAEISTTLDIPRRTVERYIAKALEHCLKQTG